jgi:prepilin-type N-terminal cleavage/methylation domain-containing protein
MKKNLGFTLIELLVVISIISLLSSIVLSTMQDARNKAKYAKFDTEFLQIKTAVELYRSGNNGNYPNSFSEGESVDSLITELHNANIYPNDNITLPTGYYWGGIYKADGTGLQGLVTCGSPEPSGNIWSIYLDTQEAGFETSKLPKGYLNGELVYQDGTWTDYNWHCIEV